VRQWRSTAFSGALLALCGTLFLWRLGTTPLDDFDESYYAEGARQMLEQGNLWMPYFNGEPFLLKPILIFWLNAAAFRLLGTTEFAARLPSAFFAAMTVLATYWFGARTLGRRAGWLAGIALALSYLWIDTARESMTDMPLTAALTSGMFLLFLAGRASPARRRWLYLACYPLFGIALLAKGPAALLVVLAGFAVYAVRAGRLVQTLAQAQLLPGIALMLMVAAPWYIYATLYQPEFAQVFFIREHFGHLSGELTRDEAWWGHVKNLLAGLYPWVVFLPAGLARAFGERDRSHVLRFAAWWAIAVVAVHSLAGAKLPHYLVPGFPPMALLVGAWLDAWSERTARGRFWPALAFGLLAVGGAICACGLVLALVMPPGIARRVAAQYGTWTPGPGPTVILAALTVGALAAVGAAAAGRRRAVAPVLAAAMGAAAIAHVGWFKPRIAEIQAQPRKELAQLASTVLLDSEPFAVFYAKRPATVFYARRAIVDLGEDEPQGLVSFLSSPSPATALTHARFLPLVRETLPTVQVWARRGDFVLISNHGKERPGL
jgi:4-amino-4-deoxy-L-arabinose transferase-like glycosyltransferase